MTLADILWDNWARWSAGGLNSTVIEQELSDGDLTLLLRWLDTGYQSASLTRPLLTAKRAIDIASWCLHGTHSLLLKPRDIREDELQHAAATFGLTRDILASLIINLTPLEEHTREERP